MLLQLKLNKYLYDGLLTATDEESVGKMAALNKAMIEFRVQSDSQRMMGESILRLDLAAVGKLPKSSDSRTALLFKMYRRYKDLIK